MRSNWGNTGPITMVPQLWYSFELMHFKFVIVWFIWFIGMYLSISCVSIHLFGICVWRSLALPSFLGGDGVPGVCPLSTEPGAHPRHDALLWEGGGKRDGAVGSIPLLRPQEDNTRVVSDCWRVIHLVKAQDIFFSSVILCSSIPRI